MQHDVRCQVHFGGPDLVPGRLRDLLAERVAAVPAGGAIDFITYYFRDRRLAAELLAAKRRGATVRVTLDGRPRSSHANDAVIRLLAGPGGLGTGLRVVRGGKLLRPRLHEKLYCFSHPSPAAFVGSFNPSGDSGSGSRSAARDRRPGSRLQPARGTPRTGPRRGARPPRAGAARRPPRPVRPLRAGGQSGGALRRRRGPLLAAGIVDTR